MKITKENIAELESLGFLENCTYLLFNEQTGYYYIGSSVEAKRRLRDHFRDLKSGTHSNSKFQHAFNKDQEFEVEVVPLNSREEALQLEQLLIDEHRGDPKLLNLALDVASPRLGVKASEETVERQSKSLRAYYERGGVNSMEGKTHSSETKARLSALAREQFSDPATRELLSQRAKKRYSVQQNRDLTSRRTSEAMEDPNLRSKLSKSSIVRWEDAEQRRLQSERAKKRFSDPEQLKVAQKGGKKVWEDPAFRDRMTRKVSVDGVVYESLTQAAKQFGVSIATVCQRAESNSERFKSWKYV